MEIQREGIKNRGGQGVIHNGNMKGRCQNQRSLNKKGQMVIDMEIRKEGVRNSGLSSGVALYCTIKLFHENNNSSITL